LWEPFLPTSFEIEARLLFFIDQGDRVKWREYRQMSWERHHISVTISGQKVGIFISGLPLFLWAKFVTKEAQFCGFPFEGEAR
jgi:hypothetical protein